MTYGPKTDIAQKHLGYSGACLGSLSGFERRMGYSFNKNQCVVVGGLEGEMIWYGDIDLVRNGTKLQALANELGEPVELYAEPWYQPEGRPWPWLVRSMALRNELYEPEDST